MLATARKRNAFQETPAWVETGNVTAIDDRISIVRRRDGSVVEASRAASCLIEPAAGDWVALLPVSSQEFYVIAVLERAGDEALALWAPGGLTVSVPRGRFTVAAEGIDLVGKEVALRGQKTTIDAQSVRLSFRELAAFGAEVLVQSDTVKMAGRFASAVFESVMMRAARSYRVISELEHMSGRQLSYSVRENASIHARNNLLTAEELVKVDGQQIHVG